MTGESDLAFIGVIARYTYQYSVTPSMSIPGMPEARRMVSLWCLADCRLRTEDHTSVVWI